MKKKIAYAVFSYTLEGNKEYMVRGNFGKNKTAADAWAEENQYLYARVLFVKEVKY